MTPHSAISIGCSLAALGLAAAVLRKADAKTATAQPDATSAALSGPLADAMSPEVWRKEKRIIDLHQHIEGELERFDRAAGIMDKAGVGIGFNLGAGTVTRKDGQLVSDFERVQSFGDVNHPGTFVPTMILDYTGFDEPGWSEDAVSQIVKGHGLGSAGLKEFKRLGLFLKDGKGQLIKIDDPKLDPVWAKCGELGMPVSIHVADPRAFWLPYDAKNERWEELKDHKSWWFGDAAKHPPRMELLEALDRVIARHRGTTFICVHFGNNAEDPDWVDLALDRNPNMMIDIAARIPEVGRHTPEKLRAFFTKHQDRILFATDFMVYNKLILGSGGDAEQPTDGDGLTFFQKCWKWFETDDRNWAHMTPIQGPWPISSIKLPPAICRKVYFDNARRVFARALPLPVVRAARVVQDFTPNGKPDDAAWANAPVARLEYQSGDSAARPDLSTAVRVLWSADYLYLLYEAPYTELTVFEPRQKEERVGLWEKDVVEAFIGADPENPTHYTEYQWAPNGEQLDLKLRLPERDFPWSSGMESAVRVDDAAKVWTAEARIPLKAISDKPPAAGTKWRINLFRCDIKGNAGLAFSPSLKSTFHAPERFASLEFLEK